MQVELHIRRRGLQNPPLFVQNISILLSKKQNLTIPKVDFIKQVYKIYICQMYFIYH
jgi:hypothetical protein